MTENKRTPPVAEREPREITQHGKTRVDPYFWLRDGQRERIVAYLEAENAYTTAVLKDTEQLQGRLYAEMVGRVQQTDMSAPVPMPPYEYFTRTVEGRQYAVYGRRKGGVEETLLDLNVLGDGKEYLRLGNFAVSPDQRLLAYSIDFAGDEVYTTFVKDLATGELLPDRLENTYYGLAWTNDSQALFYVTLDEAKRPYQAWRHKLGATEDELLLSEDDERFHLTIHKSRSKAYVFLELDSAATSEVHYVDLSETDGKARLFAARVHDVEYDVEHHGGWFYVRTSEGGRNFRVMRTPVFRIEKQHWMEWLGHRATVMVEGVEPFARHIVITEREEGIPRLRIRGIDGSEHTVAMPEPAYTLDAAENPSFHTTVFRYQYTSLVTPPSVFAYDMDTRERVLVKQQPVLGGYIPDEYETLRLWTTAADGVRIPISLVQKKGMARDGQAPLLLYGYGSYGISIDPAFASERLSLLERGFRYAIAHIRGGGDLGKPWHDAGKLEKKWNTFDDFILAAEFLIAEGYTKPERLAIIGGSAGGLLMGTVINKRPELFQAVIAKVPFVDVLNTATDATLPLTVIEYDEWGNSNERKYWELIRSYAPYENVTAQAYPHVLVTAGLNDPRVSYWEPAKWVAKLRTLKTDGNLLLLKTNMAAGHGGASGRYERWKELALDYAFLLKAMGEARRDSA